MRVRRTLEYAYAGAVLLLLVALLGSGAGVVRAQTNTLESVATYRQCNVRDFSPDEAGQFKCDGPQGYTTFVVNMKPGTGGGDTYQTTMDSNQFNATRTDYALSPGADSPRDRGIGTPTNIVVQMGNVYVRYQTRLRLISPSSYDTMRFSGDSNALIIGSVVAGIVAPIAPPFGQFGAAFALLISYSVGIGRSFKACNGGATAKLCAGRAQRISDGDCYVSPGLGLAAARCDPRVNPLTCPLATPAEMNSPCVRLSCGSCTPLGGGPDRFACNSEIFWWVKPLWRVYDIMPLPVVEYTVTVNITSAQTGQSELIVLGSASGSTTRAIPCANCTNVDQTPTNGGFHSFTLVGFSQNGAVRAEILSQSRFGIIPYQPGIIVAADDPDGEWGRGYEEGTFNPRSQGATPAESVAICATSDFDKDAMLSTPGNIHHRTRPTDAFCAPPRNWFWGINFQNEVRFGNCCNCFGVTPEWWLSKEGADFSCSNDHHSCVPGVDFWSSLARLARPPGYFVEENLRFHRDSQQFAGNASVPGVPRAQTPFFMPQPACAGPGCENVWMHLEQLFVVPPQNTGTRVRLAVRVAGNFSRIVRTLGVGELRQVNNGTNDCTLTLGRQGLLFVDMCNTGAKVADYSAQIACQSPTYDTEVSTVSQTIDAGNCFRANFSIGLSGETINNQPAPCQITMYDAENNLLSNLSTTCVEQDISIIGPGGGTPAPSALNNCMFNAWCDIPNWVKMLIILVLGGALILCALLMCCVAMRTFSGATRGSSSFLGSGSSKGGGGTARGFLGAGAKVGGANRRGVAPPTTAAVRFINQYPFVVRVEQSAR